MGKVHDQIKAVLGAWGEWTSKCPCICAYCIMLDGNMVTLTNSWSAIDKKQAAKIKSNRPKLIVRRVLSAWASWKESKHEPCQFCEHCGRLNRELKTLNQLIEAGPEEEKG